MKKTLRVAARSTPTERAATAYESGRFEEAALLYRQVVEHEPERSHAWGALASSLLKLDLVPEAVAALTTAVALAPRDARLRYNLARALQLGAKLVEAVRAYAEVLALDPNLAEAYGNMAVALRDLGLNEDARQCLGQAIALRPDAPHAHMNLGNVLKDLGRPDEAEASYRRALALDPSLSEARSNLLFCLHYAGRSPAEIFAAHCDWDLHHGGARALLLPLPAPRPVSPGTPLRVGYVSPDFQEHSVACFSEPVIANHDPRVVQAYLYSDCARPDAVTQRFRALVGDRFRDARTWSHEELCRRIRLDEIDILVDLAGHTGRNRLPVFARRAAPVQVSWIGYPDTTGLSAMDYRFTDESADPIGTTETLHVEELARLPHGFLCYRPPDDAPAVGPPPSDHIGRVTFGCFGALPKVSPQTIELWAALLECVPGSRLVLKSRSLADATTCTRVLTRFAEAGVAPDRLVLLGHTASRSGHLAAYAEIDIALDTFPYAGTTTTCEAMWMGVPVVTLAGPTHMSRVGASLMRAVGLTDLVASNGGDWVERAVALALDTEKRAELRSTLRDKMRKSPLLDAVAFTRSLEAEYGALHRNPIATSRQRRLLGV